MSNHESRNGEREWRERVERVERETVGGRESGLEERGERAPDYERRRVPIIVVNTGIAEQSGRPQKWNNGIAG